VSGADASADASGGAAARGAPPRHHDGVRGVLRRHRIPAPLTGDAPLAGAGPLIDAHAHFLHDRGPRAEWAEVNAARLRAGERIGITWHVSSVLGSWGRTSPTYFASPADVSAGNDAQYAVVDAHPARVRAWVHVNPNHTGHALAEIDRGVARGAIGIKLSASRRADDPLLDPIMTEAARRELPVLHHIWQHRRRDWGGQEASDAVELGRLAARHPRVRFLLAHIGGGGDWAHTNPAVRDLANVSLDLSGSGVDRGMLDAALAAVGPRRLVWGADLTLCTGLAKLRALEVIGLGAEELADIRWRNAVRLFPPGSFPGLRA
jgi:predicted TIM-barrel fold metal-dependent hydrolase